MTNSDQLRRSYNKLFGLNYGLINSGRTGYMQQHEWVNFNTEVEALAEILGDDHIKSFTIIPKRMNSQNHVNVNDFTSSVNGLLHYIYREYENMIDVDEPPVAGGSSPANYTTAPVNVNQSNSQATSISIEFNQTILSLNENLTRKESDYDEGSKERNFITKLKEALPTAKSTLEVISLILKVGSQLKLPVDKLLEIIK